MSRGARVASLGRVEGTATVRDARMEDAAGIARVHVRTWQAAYEHVFGREALAALTVEGRRAGWERILAEPGSSITLVAEEAGEVVGFAGGGPPRDQDLDPARTAELYAI